MIEISILRSRLKIEVDAEFSRSSIQTIAAKIDICERGLYLNLFVLIVLVWVRRSEGNDRREQSCFRHPRTIEDYRWRCPIATFAAVAAVVAAAAAAGIHST